MLTRPDILVLGGGGVLGEAWLTGVLAGLEDRTGFALTGCEYFVGTSAGSIVAARLAGGLALQRPAAPVHGPRLMDEHPGPPESQRRLAGRIAGLALARTHRPRAAARAAALRAIPAGTRSLSELREWFDERHWQFDGRLRVAAVARASGRRVMFGSPGAPAASVAAAVEASCAVPWIFAPVSIGGVEYVDGGWWSPTNLDAAPAARGSHVLCLNPTAGWRGPGVGAAAGGLSRAVMEVEAATLRARGALVTTVGLSRAVAAAIGPNLMDPSRRDEVGSLGYQQGLELALVGR